MYINSLHILFERSTISCGGWGGGRAGGGTIFAGVAHL